MGFGGDIQTGPQECSAFPKFFDLPVSGLINCCVMTVIHPSKPRDLDGRRKGFLSELGRALGLTPECVQFMANFKCSPHLPPPWTNFGKSPSHRYHH